MRLHLQAFAVASETEEKTLGPGLSSGLGEEGGGQKSPAA